MSTYYVEVSEHETIRETVPFTSVRPAVPGALRSAKVYGPYSAIGAERVARRALSQVNDDYRTYPSTGHRYATDDNGTRLVKILLSLPYGWDTAIRNMPRESVA